MAGRTTGVCVIGAGRAGMIHARSFAGSIPGAGLVALCDPSEPALRAAAAELDGLALYTSPAEAFADPAVEAVIVVTPTDLHRDIVVAAARAGKHVLCEKPMAMDADECRDMIDACDEAGVTLQIGFMRRFDESYRRAYDQIAGGSIGRVNQIKSLTHGPSEPQPWMLDVVRSNGPLAEVSSHDIDTLRWFASSEIVEVYAIAANYRCEVHAAKYPDFYDTFVLTCRFANGLQGVIDGAVAVGYGYDARTEVLGSDGIVCIGDLRADRVVSHRRGGAMEARTVPSWRTLFREAYRAEAVGFIEAIRGGTVPAVTGLDGLAAVRVVNAGNESIRTGRPVTLDWEAS